MESDDEYEQYDYDRYLAPMQVLTPERPSKMNPVSEQIHKEWIKERKEKGNKRFDKKTKAATKRAAHE